MSSHSSVRISVKLKSMASVDGSADGKPECINEESDGGPSHEALTFLETIADSDFEYIVFSDQLITTSDTGRQLGEFIVRVEEGKFEGQECYVIHANSHGSIDNVPCGTSIVAHIGKKLETLHQQHHEYVKLVNCPLDRKTSTFWQEDGLSVSRTVTQGDEVTKLSKTFTKDQVKGFISEGSNLLLHRLLISKSIPNNCVFISFDSDINLCSAKYKHLEERLQTIDDIQIKVYGIERTIVSNTDLPTSWHSYFTSDGFLANRVQIGSPVIMKLAKFPEPLNKDVEPPKPTFSMAELDWYQDMQLFSMFIDHKEELKGEHGTYLHNHPDLRAILADFVQYLLLHKPKDVISFASEYFTSFSARMPRSGSFAASSKEPSRASTRLGEMRDEYDKES